MLLQTKQPIQQNGRSQQTAQPLNHTDSEADTTASLCCLPLSKSERKDFIRSNFTEEGSLILSNSLGYWLQAFIKKSDKIYCMSRHFNHHSQITSSLLIFHLSLTSSLSVSLTFSSTGLQHLSTCHHHIVFLRLGCFGPHLGCN